MAPNEHNRAPEHPTAAELHRYHTDRWQQLLLHAALDELSATTFSTEAAWLSTVNETERRAVRLAYWSLWQTLPQLLEQRSEPVSAESRQTLVANLRTLIHTAARDTTGTQSPIIEPQPFQSSIPIIGPVIVGIRSLWNRIAAGPFADRMRHRQNNFNNAAVARLRQLENRLTAIEDDTLTDELHTGLLQLQQSSETATFAAIDDLLESVAVRLQAVEQRNR
ncbi:MAG: hypothetical protein M9941_13120 [Anaerolineae bacterium]|nr:hypothetical protein [Anaerolineae bacterium]MCO5198678.1 hypothetical protein [Anaerolineae bacterium]